ncbi:MAG: pantoate--beta-alanine ligase [Deltaproteobacteria bacterium]|nr:pantoate--beta-alanine ligase [Deltaproteobacteria bacterium]
MKIIRSIKKMQGICVSHKGKKTIALVPTMGCLHQGHLSLVKIAQKKAAITIVSIFVNPTQFAPHEDFAAYPRNEKADINKLKALGVDYCFIPKDSDMYPCGYQTVARVNNITTTLCGKSRPHHFSGVTTVVLKLFGIIQPDFAVFGQKDYQQFLTIGVMAKDLNLPIKVVMGKIIREKDGLAMSSRNTFLSQQERKTAACMSLALHHIKKLCLKQNMPVKKIRSLFFSELSKHKGVRVDYFECLNANDLSKMTQYRRGNTLMAAAIFVGRVRLIDNIII